MTTNTTSSTSHTDGLEPRFVSRMTLCSRVAAYLVILLGAIVLVGWAFGIHVLTGGGGSITMKANAALAFVLVGSSLALVDRRGLIGIQSGIVLAIATSLIGAATLSQHLFGWNLGIDQFLFTEAVGALATTSPGRMGPPASTCFTLAGIALVLLHRRRAPNVVVTLSMVVLLLALFAVTGYAYGAQPLYGVARYTGIALHTALAFVALAFALAFARFDSQIVRAVGSVNEGGRMARRILVFAIVTPFVLGLLTLYLQRIGSADQGLGTAVLVISIIILLSLVIVRNAARLNYEARLRVVAEAGRQQREHLLQLTNERLLAARNTAEEAVRLKDEFLATVSHELRTPLNAILGWITLLNGEDVDEATRRTALETIERNARIQSGLVNDILDVSRIVAGKIQLDGTRVVLNEVIDAAIATVRPTAIAKNVELIVSAHGSQDELIVRGDAARLQQVVWNLLSNAIKFSDSGGRVRISAARHDGFARIVASDNGAGITAEFLPYVFDRFLQADGSETRRHGGLGLGLAIARHYVEMHGGSIAVTSDGPGKGSEFTVELPLVNSDVVDSAIHSEHTTHRSHDLSGMRILAVDDAPDSRAMLEGVLSHYGADVRVVADALAVVALVPEWKPHILICDLSMPEYDGIDLIKRIRGLAPDRGGRVPAIALTGRVRPEDRRRALEAGFQLFATKPIESAALVEIVAGLARTHAESTGA